MIIFQHDIYGGYSVKISLSTYSEYLSHSFSIYPKCVLWRILLIMTIRRKDDDIKELR